MVRDPALMTNKIYDAVDTALFFATDDENHPGAVFFLLDRGGDSMLSRKPDHVGSLAFSRTGDLATGEFGDAKLIGKFGDFPDDLSAL